MLFNINRNYELPYMYKLEDKKSEYITFNDEYQRKIIIYIF
jgi:hypothetical protein